VSTISFGDNLRTLLEERNLTQKEFAKQINIAPSTLGSYVQNVREPDFCTLKLIAKYFNVTTDFLLDYSVNDTNDYKENEMIRVFHSLSNYQKDICLEQCKVFLKSKYKRMDG